MNLRVGAYASLYLLRRAHHTIFYLKDKTKESMISLAFSTYVVEHIIVL